MTNKNKLKLLLSSLVILLPSVAAIILNKVIEPKIPGAWHFGWILPIFLVLMHIFLHLITFRENERVQQNPKIVNITFWILPVLSAYISALFMMLSFGLENALGVILSVFFGTLFVVLGNFMPKSVQNRTFGLKIKWTLANEENWAATHRFAGKVWVISGIITLIGAFLPEMASVILLIAVAVPAVVLPIIYSYRFYKKQLADGTATKENYSNYPKSAMDKKTGIISAVVGAVVVVGVIILMFVGSLSFAVGDEALEIDTTFGGGMTLDYDDIKSVEYRLENISGMRVSGFASSKLLYGWFKNDELGNYTRYTYTGSEAGIIIRTYDGSIIVIAEDSRDKTKELYDRIAEKIYGDDL